MKSDSKLEEIKKRCFLQDGDLFHEDAAELFSLIAEQDQEIEQLQRHQDSGPITERDYLTALEHRAEKAEIELIQTRHYNDVLQQQRADVYKEGIEDGKREAEAKIKQLKGWNEKRIKYIERLEGEGLKLQADNRHLQERVRKLRKYAAHLPDCLFWNGATGCDCGLETVLKALQHKKQE